MNARAIGIVLIALLASVAGAGAQGSLGIGIIVGEPTGISVKKWTSPEHAIDAAAAWSLTHNGRFQFHADYLIHNFRALRTEAGAGRLPVYFGIGGRVKLREVNNTRTNDDDALIGVRIPFGVSYIFATAPVDLFAEIVPVLDLAPATDFDINGAVGIRLWLK